jgi:hypothetical protein
LSLRHGSFKWRTLGKKTIREIEERNREKGGENGKERWIFGEEVGNLGVGK